MIDNRYTKMQKSQYKDGTSNHEEHNKNPDYWDILLGELKDNKKWQNKNALDFACGKGRNVTNLFNICDWDSVDGVDISSGNIDFCNTSYKDQNSSWYLNNGIDVSDLKSNHYDFVMSTIAFQHIPVYDIRKSLITDILRVLKPKGVFSFQMAYGKSIEKIKIISSYFSNEWDAVGTNSVHDVRIQSEKQVVDDLIQIGFSNIETYVRDSFSDSNHPKWIYVKCFKK